MLSEDDYSDMDYECDCDQCLELRGEIRQAVESPAYEPPYEPIMLRIVLEGSEKTLGKELVLYQKDIRSIIQVLQPGESLTISVPPDGLVKFS